MGDYGHLLAANTFRNSESWAQVLGHAAVEGTVTASCLPGRHDWVASPRSRTVKPPLKFLVPGSHVQR